MKKKFEISPLTRDEEGQLKGGFEKIGINNQCLREKITNKNCHGSRPTQVVNELILTRHSNTNCYRSCTCGG